MSSKLFNLKNLIWFCAIGLAAFSGYYSVFGIAKLFSGGSWSIIGMAAMLELSKLVVVTFLHDHFKTLRLLFKTYLLSAAVVLMVITSIGVYGYLTNSYQETAKVVYKAQNEITLLDQKRELFVQQKVQLDKLIDEKNNRLKSLDNIRVSQQNAYTEQLSQKRGTGGLSRSMSSVDKSSETLNTEISTLTVRSFALSDSIAKIDQTKLTVSNETFSSELGPLLYLSRITGIPMDNVVNWFILILVIVFDPLAVSLVIAANHLSGKEKQNKMLDKLNQLDEEIEYPKEESDFFQNVESVDSVDNAVVGDDINDMETKTVQNQELHDFEELHHFKVEDNIDHDDNHTLTSLEDIPIDDNVPDTIDIQDQYNAKRHKNKRLKKTVKSSILSDSSKLSELNSDNEDEQRKFYEELSGIDATVEPPPMYGRYKRGISV